MGDDAYGDPDKFPRGPYCETGNWVIFRSYTGTRFKVQGQEFRLINDDSVEAIVEDPRGIERA
jgi:co-chaperonin GroES (HSP10)